MITFSFKKKKRKISIYLVWNVTTMNNTHMTKLAPDFQQQGLSQLYVPVCPCMFMTKGIADSDRPGNDSFPIDAS